MMCKSCTNASPLMIPWCRGTSQTSGMRFHRSRARSSCAAADRRPRRPVPMYEWRGVQTRAGDFKRSRHQRARDPCSPDRKLISEGTKSQKLPSLAFSRYFGFSFAFGSFSEPIASCTVSLILGYFCVD